jgi:hypothetical protein
MGRSTSSAYPQGTGDKGILKIASELGVGPGTVQRIKAEMAAAA